MRRVVVLGARLSGILVGLLVERRVLDGLGRVVCHRDGEGDLLGAVRRDVLDDPLDVVALGAGDVDAAVRGGHERGAGGHVVADAHVLGDGGAGVLGLERVDDLVAFLDVAGGRHRRALVHRHAAVGVGLGLGLVARAVGRAFRLVGLAGRVALSVPAVLEHRLVGRGGELRALGQGDREAHGLGPAGGHREVRPHDRAVHERAAVGGGDERGVGGQRVLHARLVRGRAAGVAQRDGVGHVRAGCRRGLLGVEVGRRREVGVGRVLRRVRRRLRVVRVVAGLAGVVVGRLVERRVLDGGLRRVEHLDGELDLLGAVGRDVGDDPLDELALGAVHQLAAVRGALERGALRHVVADAHELGHTAAGVLGLERVDDALACCHGRAGRDVRGLVDRHVAGVFLGLGRVLALVADLVGRLVGLAGRLGRAVPGVGEGGLVGHGLELGAGLDPDRHGHGPLAAGVHGQVGPHDRAALVERAVVGGGHERGARGHAVLHAGVGRGRAAAVLQRDGVDDLVAFRRLLAGAAGSLLGVDVGRGLDVGVGRVLRRVRAAAPRVLVGLGARLAGIVVGRLVEGRVLHGRLGVGVHRHGEGDGLGAVGRDVGQHPLDERALVVGGLHAAVGGAVERGAFRHVVADAHELRRAGAGVLGLERVGDLPVLPDGRAGRHVGGLVHGHVAGLVLRVGRQRAAVGVHERVVARDHLGRELAGRLRHGDDHGLHRRVVGPALGDGARRGLAHQVGVGAGLGEAQLVGEGRGQVGLRAAVRRDRRRQAAFALVGGQRGQRGRVAVGRLQGVGEARGRGVCALDRLLHRGVLRGAVGVCRVHRRRVGDDRLLVVAVLERLVAGDDGGHQLGLGGLDHLDHEDLRRGVVGPPLRAALGLGDLVGVDTGLPEGQLVGEGDGLAGRGRLAGHRRGAGDAGVGLALGQRGLGGLVGALQGEGEPGAGGRDVLAGSRLVDEGAARGGAVAVRI